MRLRHALAIGLTAATTIAPTAFSTLTPPAQAATVRPDVPGAGEGDMAPDASAAVRPWTARADAAALPSGHTLTDRPFADLLFGAPRPALRPLFAPGIVADPEPGPAAERQPSCGNASDRDFPINTRIHGGPATYRAGSGPKTWSLDLTNNTDEACHNIHPVLVVTDQERGLTASQVTLELRDTEGLWRPLSLERSDADETIGFLEGDFPGFVVPAGETLTVEGRFAFTAGTRPDTMVVSAAAVQRRGDDGDWVGESDDYRFKVVKGAARRESDVTTGRGESPRPPKDSTGPGKDAGRGTGKADAPRPSVSPSAPAAGKTGGARTDGGTDGDATVGTEPGAGRSDAPATGHSAAADTDSSGRPDTAPSAAPGVLDSAAPSAAPSVLGSAAPSAGSGAGHSAGPSSRPTSGPTGRPDGTSRAPVAPGLADTGFGALVMTAVGGTLLLAGSALVIGARRRAGSRRP